MILEKLAYTWRRQRYSVTYKKCLYGLSQIVSFSKLQNQCDFEIGSLAWLF